MKILAILITFNLLSLTLSAQEVKPEFDGKNWVAPYVLPIPDGWHIERFLIPIEFASQIPYKGVEDIRFAPGFSKSGSENYWSYAFLWYLDGDVKINAKTIDSNLRHYYEGLTSANAPDLPKDKLIPVEASFKEVKKDIGDLKTFSGTVKIVDYMSQNPIVLNGKVHLRSCQGEKKTFAFYELSPQPFSHNIWVSLDKLWSDFQCKK